MNKVVSYHIYLNWICWSSRPKPWPCRRHSKYKISRRSIVDVYRSRDMIWRMSYSDKSKGTILYLSSHLIWNSQVSCWRIETWWARNVPFRLTAHEKSCALLARHLQTAFSNPSIYVQYDIDNNCHVGKKRNTRDGTRFKKNVSPKSYISYGNFTRSTHLILPYPYIT